jgi:hypothetical protein
MCIMNSGGKIPVAQENSSYCPFDLAVLRTEVERLMQTFNMQQALHAGMTHWNCSHSC